MALLTSGFPLCGQVPGSWKDCSWEELEGKVGPTGILTSPGGCFRGEADMGKSYLMIDRAWHAFLSGWQLNCPIKRNILHRKHKPHPNPDFNNQLPLSHCLSESESRSVVSNSLRPQGLYRPWNSPGQNTGVGCLSLLQGIFPTQGLNPGLLHCRRILYQLSHQGSRCLREPLKA